jgi:hypothetical protein
VSALILALLLALQPGPQTVDDKDEESCTVFAPATLEGKHPIILWGNGTMTPVAAYAPTLRLWASHGYVVAAAKTGQPGSGFDMLRCLDRLTAREKDEKSFWHGHLDLTKVGAAGHSQGGSGALMAARDRRISATAPIQPGGRVTAETAAAQTAPMLLLSGGVDVVAPPQTAQAPIFERAGSPVVWATLRTATHTTPVNRENPYSHAALAFFDWRLKGDQQAARQFEGEACALCRDPDWEIRRR